LPSFTAPKSGKPGANGVAYATCSQSILSKNNEIVLLVTAREGVNMQQGMP
jgi:hypothetical protein